MLDEYYTETMHPYQLSIWFWRPNIWTSLMRLKMVSFMSKFGAVKPSECSIWTCASTTKVIVQIFVNCGSQPTWPTHLQIIFADAAWEDYHNAVSTGNNCFYKFESLIFYRFCWKNIGNENDMIPDDSLNPAHIKGLLKKLIVFEKYCCRPFSLWCLLSSSRLVRISIVVMLPTLDKNLPHLLMKCLV